MSPAPPARLSLLLTIPSNGFWEFTASGYSVGSAGQTSSSIDAIADTGVRSTPPPQLPSRPANPRRPP